MLCVYVSQVACRGQVLDPVSTLAGGDEFGGDGTKGKARDS